MIDKEKVDESLEFVVNNSNYVSFNQEALEQFVKNFVPTTNFHWSQGSNAYPLKYKPRFDKNDEIDFLFILGNQAFCYWGYPTKWTIDYRGQKLDGWWANIAAFDRALEEGNNLLDGDFLANITLEKTREIFRGEPEIPLLSERFEMMKAIGETLVKKYKGRFHNFYQNLNKNAWTLIEAFVKEFAGFDDTPIYKDKEILFYKKTQVILTDLREAGERIDGMDELLGTADYKIPAIMRSLGILEYSLDLVEKVDNQVEITKESEMEIEIRASMLQASKLISEKLQERGIQINRIDVGNALWLESQDKSKITKPYHLTKTVYY